MSASLTSLVSLRLKLAYLRVLGLDRGDYKKTWDKISTTPELAMIGVAGTQDVDSYFESGEVTADTLRDALGITSNDVVLEIGCGAARIGKSLAPQCNKWIGCDISTEMLRHANAVLNGSSNVELIELFTCSLDGIADNSIDKVYCTAVFMHLDEWDRYKYVTEAYRVLRPGGMAYFDNINLAGEIGWGIFLEMSKYDSRTRPPNISKSSTSEELNAYLARAGYVHIELRPGQHFVAALGRKPQ